MNKEKIEELIKIGLEKSEIEYPDWETIQNVYQSRLKKGITDGHLEDEGVYPFQLTYPDKMDLPPVDIRKQEGNNSCGLAGKKSSKEIEICEKEYQFIEEEIKERCKLAGITKFSKNKLMWIKTVSEIFDMFKRLGHIKSYKICDEFIELRNKKGKVIILPVKCPHK